MKYSTNHNRKPFHVAVHAFFIKNHAVLLLKRANSGYMDGFWSVPAGHVDGGETIWEAMKREILEEVGVVFANELGPVHVMHRIKGDERAERIDYFFMITHWSGEPKNCEHEKCDELKWFSSSKLPEKIVPYVAFGLENVLNGKVFSEFLEE
ncbi:MAG: NUDIX domain-containing protein [Microgenomates group bacterium]